mgnify:CR=1 FL=1
MIDCSRIRNVSCGSFNTTVIINSDEDLSGSNEGQLYAAGLNKFAGVKIESDNRDDTSKITDAFIPITEMKDI